MIHQSHVDLFLGKGYTSSINPPKPCAKIALSLPEKRTRYRIAWTFVKRISWAICLTFGEASWTEWFQIVADACFNTIFLFRMGRVSRILPLFGAVTEYLSLSIWLSFCQINGVLAWVLLACLVMCWREERSSGDPWDVYSYRCKQTETQLNETKQQQQQHILLTKPSPKSQGIWLGSNNFIGQPHDLTILSPHGSLSNSLPSR